MPGTELEKKSVERSAILSDTSSAAFSEILEKMGADTLLRAMVELNHTQVGDAAQNHDYIKKLLKIDEKFRALSVHPSLAGRQTPSASTAEISEFLGVSPTTIVREMQNLYKMWQGYASKEENRSGKNNPFQLIENTSPKEYDSDSLYLFAWRQLARGVRHPELVDFLIQAAPGAGNQIQAYAAYPNLTEFAKAQKQKESNFTTYLLAHYGPNWRDFLPKVLKRNTGYSIPGVPEFMQRELLEHIDEIKKIGVITAVAQKERKPRKTFEENVHEQLRDIRERVYSKPVDKLLKSGPQNPPEQTDDPASTIEKYLRELRGDD